MSDPPAPPAETPSAPRPRLVIVNPSYWKGHKMRCRLGDGPEFAAFSSLVVQASPELKRAVSESPAASAVLRRYHRIMWTGYCISILGGALLGLCIASPPFIHMLQRDDWTAMANTILPILWPTGLCVVACGFALDYASYRCFLKMVETYNGAAQAGQPAKEP